MPVLLALLFLAALWDVRKKKIPNPLIIAGYLCGIARLMLMGSYPAVIAHLPGVVFPLLLLFPFFCINALGAGDVKLLSLLGWFLPAEEVLYCLFLSFAIGALCSLAILLADGSLSRRLRYLACYLRSGLLKGCLLPYHPPGEAKEKGGGQLALALPVFIGALFYFTLR